MKYLLDTNVVSEGSRPQADARVRHWLDGVDPDDVYISVITFAEIRRGISRLTSGVRRVALERWLAADLLPTFDGRVLAIDGAIADEWGRLTARLEGSGRPASVLDAFIAATALHHDLTVVTRNVDDFTHAGVRILNPWTAGAH